MPFAGYRDFAECVRRNRDKRDPEAYCGAIEHKVNNPDARTVRVRKRDGKSFRVKYRKRG